jgi:hypothetical protein
MVLRRRGEDDDEATQGETRRNERWKSLLVDITIIKQTVTARLPQVFFKQARTV